MHRIQISVEILFLIKGNIEELLLMILDDLLIDNRNNFILNLVKYKHIVVSMCARLRTCVNLSIHFEDSIYYILYINFADIPIYYMTAD